MVFNHEFTLIFADFNMCIKKVAIIFSLFYERIVLPQECEHLYILFAI
jgi:hypothetical protein